MIAVRWQNLLESFESPQFALKCRRGRPSYSLFGYLALGSRCQKQQEVGVLGLLMENFISLRVESEVQSKGHRS